MKPKRSNRRALFIDRDGVINRMVKYGDGWDSPQTEEGVVLVSDVVKTIKWANDRSIPVIEISNQPGIAKGKLSLKIASAIQQRVVDLLAKEGAFLDGVYICRHHPNGVVPKLTRKCDCRKPKPGLLLRAAEEMDIDLEKSIFLGDKESDTLAGKAAGCKTILYLHEDDEPEKVARAVLTVAADFKVRSLLEVIDILEKSSNS